MNQYDVLIVGAGVAGSALAHALSTVPRSKPLRIALLERSLAEPDRIVGELLQPGGVMALRELGLESCLEGIDAISVQGYCVVEAGKSVHIPYPTGFEGRSFHHGRFIMKLREAAGRAKGVEVIEATVTDLIESTPGSHVIGVYATAKSAEGEERNAVKTAYHAKLVVVADGCFSKFRTAVMGESALKSVTKSQFVGAILEDAVLPIPNHGTVALVQGNGPVLLYQISEHDTRMLVDVAQPLPSDIKAHILKNVMPQLPSALHRPIQTALSKERLRRMPNSFLPPVEQGRKGSKQGVILLGDSWNMRHPLTGGGMSVALHDVFQLRSLLGSTSNFERWDGVSDALHKWHWQRKRLASTVNILSFALYDLFGAEDEMLQVLRTGCFKYFERGGDCIGGPVSLLSIIAPSPMLLANHFFSVAFYSIWVMFTHPQLTTTSSGERIDVVAPIYQYPALFLKSIQVLWTACVVFGPLVWSEVRWWAPMDSYLSSMIFAFGVGLLGLFLLLCGVSKGLDYRSI